MKRKLLLTAALLTVAGFAFAKENLAILPFTGGQGNEGETIAELFSFNSRLNEVFGIIPRTSISRAISNERGFQIDSGMTDPDTVVSIANEVGARYVVAGSVTSVGNNNLLVISILDIRNLQQIAGDFQTYPRGRIEDLRGKLPGMAENIIRATLSNTADLPKLAVVPVQLEGGTDRRIADTLAQLLAIHLIRSGKYAVFPRTGSLEQVQAEHDAQMSGHTADKNIIGTGHGENPDYVLSVVARRLGSANMFNAVVINLLTRVQAVGRSVDYQDINDGMRTMETLAVDLTSTSEQVDLRQQKEEERRRREQAADTFWRNSGLGLGLRFGIGFGEESIENTLWEGGGSYLMFPLAAVADLKLGRLFSLQIEFQLNNNLGGDYYRYSGNIVNVSRSVDVYSYSFQIPVLAKFNFSWGNFALSPFLGMGFNFAGMGGLYDDKGWHYIDPEISPVASGIIGVESGLLLGKTRRWLLFADLRYSFDLWETKVDTRVDFLGADRTFSYSHTSFGISFGAKYYIPFRQ